MVLIPIALLFASVSLKYCNKLEQTNNYIIDTYHSALGKFGTRYDPKSTLIVALDHDSLTRFRDTPMAFLGPRFADVIDQLVKNGARLVVLDFQFFITPDQWLDSLHFDKFAISNLNYDKSFDKKLSEGRVILGAKLTPSSEDCAGAEKHKNCYEILDPPQEYLESLSGHKNGIGLVTFIPDKDSVIRRFLISPNENINIKTKAANNNRNAYAAPERWLTLSALAVQKSVGPEYFKKIIDNNFTDSRLIHYCGPPGTIPSISFASFFKEGGLSNQEKALINDKIVFVGLTDEFFYDKQTTPYLKFLFGFPDMNSIEIHANIAETLLHGKKLEYLSLGKTIAFVWIPFMILTLLSSEWCERIKEKREARIPVLLIVEVFPGLIFEILPAIIAWIIGLILFCNNLLLQQAILFAAVAAYLLFVKALRLYIKKSQRRP